MSTIKKGRGRPPGTGLNDDPTLRKVADVLLANPRMKPTTAMARVLDRPGPSTVRRLQVKWRVKGTTCLAEAEARRAAEREAHRRPPEAPLRRQPVEPFWASRELGTALAALDIPAIKAMQAFDSPTMHVIRELLDSRTMRVLQEIMANPAMRTLQEEMARSPTLSKQFNLPKF